jgi:rhodanese-related sulfurtransferase
MKRSRILLFLPVILLIIPLVVPAMAGTIPEEPVLQAVKEYFRDCRQGCNNLITSAELKKMLDRQEPPFLLDIRKEEHFNRQHIEGAVNIFWYDLGEHLNKLPWNRKIIVICYTGQSSGQVTSLLRIMGYDACSLLGGMDNGWMERSFPIVAECGT